MSQDENKYGVVRVNTLLFIERLCGILPSGTNIIDIRWDRFADIIEIKVSHPDLWTVADGMTAPTVKVKTEWDKG